MLTDEPTLGLLMHDVARQLRLRFDARARDLGVTRQQWRVLLQVARAEGLTQAELADRIEVERITACRMIDRLAEAGLVERRADPTDRRVWRLHLLPAAHGLVDKLSQIARALEDESVQLLGDSAEPLRVALTGLRDGLRNMPRDGGERSAA